MINDQKLQFAHAVFSHTLTLPGQIHGVFKRLIIIIIIRIREQTRQKLICFEDQTKRSKIRSVMKWWSKCLPMVIAKTASSSSSSLVEISPLIKATVLAGQSALLTREVAGAGSSIDEETLKDLGCSANLYIFHQDVIMQDECNIVFYSYKIIYLIY